MTARDRIAYASLAAMALSAPTVERIAMVADDTAAPDGDSLAFVRSEYVTLVAPPAPPAADYPRNRAERRSATNRARRGAPARRR